MKYILNKLFNNQKMEVEFKYKFSNNYLKFKLIESENEIWMEDVNLDYDHPKIFFLLLSNAIDKFIENGYKKFVQTVLKEDWDIIKDFNWKKRLDDNDKPTIIIECPIEDALINIAKGVGF